MANKIVIIGGVAAGMSAASKIRRMDRFSEIDVYTDEEYISYAACGLPYFISGMAPNVESLIARNIEQFQAQDIKVFINHRADRILPDTKTVILRKKNGHIEKSYDKLLLATGARAKKIDIFGLDLLNIHTLRNIPDGIKIKEAIKRGVKKAVIVGAGYIGIEMVETLKILGIEVTVIEAGDQVLSNIDRDMALKVENYLSEKGVNVLLNEEVLGFKGQDYVEKVVTSLREIETDLVILALGSVPNSELAESCGIELSDKRAIKVNEYMETNIKDIYAAGDCVADFHRLYKDYVYIPLGTTANKQGRIAGTNIAGGKEAFSGIIGTAITKVFDLGISRTGLSQKESENLGYKVVEEVIESKDIAGYYPESKPVTVKILVDELSHRILGAQLLGEGHFAKRIDVMALAIQNGLKIEDLVGVDFAYSPPFSSVWDPYLIIANKIFEKIKN